MMKVFYPVREQHQKGRRPEINVCLSPSHYAYYAKPDYLVVVVDAIRASASICTALSYGAKRVLPLTDIEQAMTYKQKGYLAAGERDSKQIEGFDFGNSPESFRDNRLKNRDLVMTTTNGTHAIQVAQKTLSEAEGGKLLIGSFLNIQALFEWILEQEQDVMVLCSGWKLSVNIEDTLFAGKLSAMLLETGLFESQSDEVQIALNLYEKSRGNSLFDFVIKSSARLAAKLSFLERDIRYCLTENQTRVIPILRGEYLEKI